MSTSNSGAGLSILKVENTNLKFPQAPKYQRAFEILQPKKSYFCPMETNRQKKIGTVLQKDLVVRK